MIKAIKTEIPDLYMVDNKDQDMQIKTTMVSLHKITSLTKMVTRITKAMVVKIMTHTTSK